VKKVVHHLTRTTKLLLIATTVLLALLITASRLLLPFVEDYRHELESRISQQVGKPVTVGKLGAHLRGFYPELVLKEVTVLSADRKITAAQLKEVRVGLAVSQLLTKSTIKPLWITLVGAELTVVREKDDSLSVYGLGSDGKKSEFPSWLFENGRFEILESRLFFQNRKVESPIIELTNIKVSLLNDGRRHQIDVQAELPKKEGRSLEVKIDYEGDIAFPDRWQGTIYVAGDKLLPAKILEGEKFELFDIEKGQVSFKTWSEWKGASIKSVKGEVNLSDSAINWATKSGSSRERLELKTLNGLFNLNLDKKGWGLAVTDLVVTRKGESRQEKESITVDYRDNLLRIAGSYLNLSELREALLGRSWLSNEQKKLLSGMKPSGELTDFSVIAAVAENKISKGWFCGRFNHLKLEAWQKVPSIENFEGRFCGTDQQGYVELGAGDAQLNLTSLFRTPWQISNSQGRIYWHKRAQDWRLFSDYFHVETPDIKTSTQFELTFQDGQSPFMDLQTSFEEGVIANAGFYYPTKIMPANVVGWLDSALVSGRVVSGGVLLRGRLNGYPFQKDDGVFEVLFNTENTTLVYQKGWPVLTDINAEVRFFQDDLFINADKAFLEGERVEQASVSILALNKAKWLNISGVVTGGVEQSMRFLKNSPLHNRVDALLNVMDVRGNNKIELEIDVPLRSGIGEADVAGTARLEDAGLFVHGVDLDVSAVNGLLLFDEDGIEAKALQASVLGEPVTVDLLRRKNDTLLKAKGRVETSALSKQFPMPIWPYLEGKTAYDLSLIIPMKGGKNLSTFLNVKSDTKGILVKLPKPYGKKEKEMRRFSLSLPLKGGQKSKMAIRYGDDVRAGLLFSAPGEEPFKLLKGEIGLDGKKPILPEKGLRITGVLSQFETASWEALLEKQVSDKRHAYKGDDLLQELKLEFGRLVWGERIFDNVGFNLKRQKGGWEGSIESQFGSGFMRLPDNLKGSSPLVLNLDNLILPEAEKGSKESGLQSETFSPTELPNLDITSEQLIWKGNNLGRLKLIAERKEKSVHIKELKLDSDNDHLQLNGEWLLLGKGKTETALRGTLVSSDLGNLIERLSITSALKSTSGQIGFSLKWQDSPWNLNLETLDGTAGMQFGKGQLVDFEPGAGRVLGVLSLQAIRRRMSLDFSDIFSKGFSFDSIKASYNVTSGDAITNDFFLDSPAARIDIQGRIGLVKEDFDQIVVITPRTTENLPVASALLGGPIVGAAVFVAQKLIGDRVEKVTRSRYSLTGSWDKPEMVLLGQDKHWTTQMLDRVWDGLSGGESFGDSEVK
jgi:uncharacterized protein (TIGR02099 family)